MSAPLALFSIIVALLIGAISPGPSFVLVSRTSLKYSRRNGLAAALGMGVGGAMFAVLALLGLVALLLKVTWLYVTLRAFGGLYLIYLGIQMWRGAREPLDIADTGTTGASTASRSFLIGLVTQLSNPKTAIIYASIFVALLPAPTPAWLYIALPACVFAVETSWYALVALAFSAPGPRAAYVRSKAWLDRAAGVVIGLLGVRLVSEALLPSR